MKIPQKNFLKAGKWFCQKSLWTNVDSQVRNGDVIAYMGDSGSINGSKLHFEIWGKGQKLDPEKWLRKK